MNGLAVKDVEFNGTMLKAVQDELGKIFVGVRWICEGIGFAEDRIKYERKRLQEDLVLLKGGQNFTLPTNGGKQEVLCLDIEFLPLWLAKISITPKMKNENKELVEKLIEYQMKAKDVLAKAFLKEELISETQLTHQNSVQTIQLALPNMNIQFEEINYKIDRLYDDMSKFVRFMMDWKEHSETIHPIVNNTIETYSNIMDNISDVGLIINDCQKWKKNKYDLIDNLLDVNTKFLDRKQVLNHIYRYMNKNYGIVWEQEVIDYKNNYEIDYCPSTIDIVYNNETYRSIFESILIDLISESNPIKVASTDISLEDIIAPLVIKYDDHSPYAIVTYRKIYKTMEDSHRVSWKNQISRCKKNGIDKPKKKELIISKPQLRRKFEITVRELLQD